MPRPSRAWATASVAKAQPGSTTMVTPAVSMSRPHRSALAYSISPLSTELISPVYCWATQGPASSVSTASSAISLPTMWWVMWVCMSMTPGWTSAPPASSTRRGR